VIDRRLLVLSTLWKPSALLAVVTFPIATMSAAAVLFFLTISTIVPIQGTLFHNRASYRTVLASDAPSSTVAGLRVDVVTDFPLFRPGGGIDPDVSPIMVGPELWVVADRQRLVSDVLGDDVIGTPGPGVLLDEESASLLAVKPGDQISMGFDLLNPSGSPLLITVAGLLRPYVSLGEGHHRGLLVVEAGALPQWARELVSGSQTLTGSRRTYLTFNDVPSVSGTRTREDIRDSFFGDLLSSGGWLALAAVVCLGMALWLAVAWRSTSQHLRRMRYGLALLTALGGRPSSLALLAIAPLGLLFAGSIAMAFAIDGALIFPQLLHWVAEPAVLLLPSILIAAPCFVVVAVGYRSIRYELSSQAIVELLGKEDG
jgi:hypothetical protein